VALLVRVITRKIGYGSTWVSGQAQLDLEMKQNIKILTQMKSFLEILEMTFAFR
jgi:hypothetical protein